MVFGQGAIRCHPYILKEIQAIESQNVKQFDDAFMSHIGHTIRNTVRYLLLTLSRGWLSGHVGHRLSKYERKLSWVSAMFACYADIALVTLGGLLKRKEKYNRSIRRCIIMDVSSDDSYEAVSYR